MAQERRQRSARELQRPVWSLAGLIDQGFFLLAGAASFWLAWLVWREGWSSGGWWLIGVFVVVWAITAYLALPRLHRILSSIYVPNYFIGRTRTADGLLGDPVNLALRGSEAQLHQAMTAAGWTRAEEITAQSAWRIIFSTLTGRSYPQAPVSSLFLFGRRQDFAYQQEVDGSPGKRHHVRFWRCPTGWLLPGGHQVDWLAAGTYDRSVGLSLFTLQITHKIDENTDIERDHIVQTVRQATPAVRITNLKDFSTGYHSRNGGGDSIQTDGDLPVLELGRVRAAAGGEREAEQIILDATGYETPSQHYAALLYQLWSRRPPQVSFAIVLVGVAMISTVVSTILEFVSFDQLLGKAVSDLINEGLSYAEAAVSAEWLVWGVAVLSVLWIGCTVWLARGTFRGSDRSRLLLMTLSSAAALLTSFSLTIGKMTWGSLGALVFIGLNIAIVLMLSSDAARRFTHARSRQKSTS